MREINAYKTIKERTNKILILDDVVCNHNFHQSPSLKKLIVRERHNNIAIILTFLSYKSHNKTLYLRGSRGCTKCHGLRGHRRNPPGITYYI